MSLQWALQSQVWANPSFLQIFICTEHGPECQAFVNPSAHAEMLGPQVVTVSLSSCFLARSWQPVPAPHQGQRGKQRKAGCSFSLGVAGGGALGALAGGAKSPAKEGPAKHETESRCPPVAYNPQHTHTLPTLCNSPTDTHTLPTLYSSSTDTHHPQHT